MMRYQWEIGLGLSFAVSSVFFYFIHFMIFREGTYIFRSLLEQLAFLPISVFLVTIVINQLLSRREKITILKRLNMIIGVFFSEVGTNLIRAFSNLDPQKAKIRDDLTLAEHWNKQDFDNTFKRLKTYSYTIKVNKEDFEALQIFLLEKRGFLLRLMQNPNLLEHETFTELLWAVFHLADELANRDDIRQLPESDYLHLADDIKRVYGLLLKEWLYYMKHLKEQYPYLFSLAVRTNPFNPGASAKIY